MKASENGINKISKTNVLSHIFVISFVFHWDVAFIQRAVVLQLEEEKIIENKRSDKPIFLFLLKHKHKFAFMQHFFS